MSDITIVAAVILPDSTAREEARTVIGLCCIFVANLFFGVYIVVEYAPVDVDVTRSA